VTRKPVPPCRLRLETVPAVPCETSWDPASSGKTTLRIRVGGECLVTAVHFFDSSEPEAVWLGVWSLSVPAAAGAEIAIEMTAQDLMPVLSQFDWSLPGEPLVADSDDPLDGIEVLEGPPPWAGEDPSPN